MDHSNHHVAVLGASPKSARFSNRAVRLLREHGYRVTPVHPRIAEIEGLAAKQSLHDITGPVDTLTLYVGTRRLEPLCEQIVRLRPGRVIFNPGTESEVVQHALGEAGIAWLEACTLVMLRAGQFQS